MKFLDADVKRPLASETAIVDGGNRFGFGLTDSHTAHGSEHAHVSKDRRV